ncbi:hypothetical protein C6I21_09275 [Alkalicoccus urumqiensis]|uniref:Uncharacterized protein n=2 Tax=Alkalicoccus urumqiensis TaxID=1548213 RepID=A0A2P6MGD7_ALKUR|nr:hypothetical protein C6I21_09275 [Alkalicoccus urumqiensis]
MWLKMTASLFMITTFVLGGVLLWLQLTQGSILAGGDEESFQPEASFTDASYYYFLPDEEIESLIDRAVTSTEGIGSYQLPVEYNGLNKPDVAFTYASPPSLRVMLEAGRVYSSYGRIPGVQEMKEKLNDEYFPIHVRFHKNRAYVYDTQLETNEATVYPEETVIRGNGEEAVHYFHKNDLPFDETASLVVEDSSDDAYFISYILDFSAYK